MNTEKQKCPLERPEVIAELAVEEIKDGYADCNVKLVVAEHQGKNTPPNTVTCVL